MRNAYLKTILTTLIVTGTIMTLSPLEASASWRQNTDRSWNYIEGNEKVRGWKKISDLWYYFHSNGKMNTGWVYYNGSWYYNNSSGEMKTGWLKYNGSWYYLNGTGAMETGWINDNGKWYYADGSGAVQTNDGESSTEVSGLPELPENYAISVQADAENKILELMNEKRIEAGLQPFTMDTTLLQVARYKSNHMIQYNYFDHTTPEGTKWIDWLETIGYRYSAIGENIAYNTYDPNELFNQWWNSPGHKANMMNPSYNKVGIGVTYGNGKYMGTQEFSN